MGQGCATVSICTFMSQVRRCLFLTALEIGDDNIPTSTRTKWKHKLLILFICIRCISAWICQYKHYD